MAQLFKVPDDTPLVGSVAFGLIDRGTNVIQVRPSSSCPLSCVFCSTDAGPCSRRRRAEYTVGLDHIMEWFRAMASIKGNGIEAHIDTVGDPFTYPKLADLVQGLADTEGVSTISLQTHGVLMDETNVSELADAGLDRINLSIDSTDPEQARTLSGMPGYDLLKVIRVAKYVCSETATDLLVAPVWVHPLNDGELGKLVRLAKDIGAGRRWPMMGIQKCEFHPHGRRTKGMKQVSWYEFYRRMKEVGDAEGANLVLKPSDFGIKPANTLAVPYRQGEKVRVRVIGPGWLRGESLAVTRDGQRAVTVVGGEFDQGADVRVRLLRTKDNILIGRPA
jgi:uncharacterized Fe-S cluster-containing radical SAM superfamily enzyme